MRRNGFVMCDFFYEAVLILEKSIIDNGLTLGMP